MKTTFHDCVFCPDCATYLANEGDILGLDTEPGWSKNNLAEGDFHLGKVPPDFKVEAEHVMRAAVEEIEGMENMEFSDTLRDAMAAELRAYWDKYASYEEVAFSRERCDLCGTTTPGPRHAGHLVIEEE